MTETLGSEDLDEWAYYDDEYWYETDMPIEEDDE